MESITKKKPGFQGVIEALEGQAELVERLYEIGLVPQETIHFKMRMMFNGPLVLSFRQATFALREEEAACIKV
ncbi:MAG: ferrous iron transport protein A [Bdellovibrionales bacterium]|nr:ferrous iron transport protein A [Bdellovibrionales bacterium]